MTNSYYQVVTLLIGNTKSPKTAARMRHIFNRLPKQKKTLVLSPQHRDNQNHRQNDIAKSNVERRRGKSALMYSRVNSKGNSPAYAPEDSISKGGHVSVASADTVEIYYDPMDALIRRVIHKHALEAMDSIDDEDIERILVPIRRMINDGVFDRTP